MTALTDFTATTIDGQERSLADYAGEVVLVVNTASQCGYTPQLAGLESIYQTYRDRGFTVLGFPCNQFGGQEPGTEEEIGEFCQKNYGVSFPMFAKVDVNGDDEHPLWGWLKSEKGGAARQPDQVELHEVPRRPGRRRHRALLAADRARRPRHRHREGARRLSPLRRRLGSPPWTKPASPTAVPTESSTCGTATTPSRRCRRVASGPSSRPSRAR